jgi:glutamate formiminotransferase/formiminotetrahydrofolate cyclodeaminase
MRPKKNQWSKNVEKIVECVPNFSEGRNKKTIEAIAAAIEKTPGCDLLDVDPGESTNRTVYTFVGTPSAVLDGAINAAKVAKERIDMSVHKGEHHRIGAMDVCPFIPVANATVEDCVAISKQFGERAANELGIPIYLYEASQDREYRKTLPQIREGQYEGLSDRIITKKWAPDFGPARFIPQWGATITGARSFLIAYNVNLLSTPNQAHRIALNLRQAGRGPREPGKYQEVKGMGWFVDEHNLAQVTINLTDFTVTPIHLMFESVKKEAKKLKVAVIGSEIVGMVPLDAMLMAAQYYIEKEDLFVLEEDQKIRLVIERLGLNSISQFDPEEKIIEYKIAKPRIEPLAGLSVRKFIESIAARSAAPGGGSASAAIAAMGAGLGSMVAKLTLGVRKFESVDARMRQLIPDLHHAAHDLIAMIDADTEAFKDYVAAAGLPDDTPEQSKLKQEKMQAGLKNAIDVPLQVMAIANGAWEAFKGVARYGNIASKSDIQVGARALETGIWGALKNVQINMKEITDKPFKDRTLKKAEKMAEHATDQCRKVLKILEDRDP